MRKADFGALRCQAANSAGIYILCPSNGKGAIVFEGIKVGANSIYPLKYPATAHVNNLWSKLATARQQKKTGHDQDVLFYRSA